MNTVGIITEYNPFHNGHLYQIQKAKEITGADTVVVVMSGDFVQRGEPAWIDKYLRTKMALQNGVDFVFELPVPYATSSAEVFALAGVSLLNALGFIDYICFGSECGDLTLLQNIASYLANPDALFDVNMRELVSLGLSYPAAKEKLLKEHFANEYIKNPTLFSSPNNILAIEYLKALKLLRSELTPITIQRKATGYHTLEFKDTFASASAIRQAKKEDDDFFNTISKVLPSSVQDLLVASQDRYPVSVDDFSTLLYYSLATISPAKSILDLNTEIFNRIQKYLPDYKSFSDFASSVKPKQYTYSRISRALLHALLNIHSYQNLYADFDALKTSSITSDDDHNDTRSDMNMTPNECSAFLAQYSLSFVPYARLLGFAKEKSAILRKVKNIPLITKPADAENIFEMFYTDILSEKKPSISSYQLQQLQDAYLNYAKYLYKKDIFASNLYAKVQQNKLSGTHRNEYRQNPIIL